MVWILFVLWYFTSCSGEIFTDPYSIAVYDRNGILLGARTASDGQWRFEADSLVPSKFETCLLNFEDKRFYEHPGVDIIAIGRAMRSNVLSSRRVSGASTLTMQIVRMSSGRPDRNWFQKIREIILATRLEIRFTKKELLALYSAHAPFGGNVVGIEAASWKYYGKKSSQLSWSEAATLAVLPNAPSLIHPGKNRIRLEEKRNRLLKILAERNLIDSVSYSLSLLERLSEKPLPMPDLALHLTEDLKKSTGNFLVKTTIDAHLQDAAFNLMELHKKRLNANGVYNGALIIANHETGEILAWHGNFRYDDPFHNPYVNMSLAPRSTGSVLKPLLYASMLHEGLLLPHSLIPDVPVYINRYSPKNFNFTYEGAVPASRALSRSLNIPAVHLLKEYSTEKFCHFLKKAGITTMTRKPSTYGLSLILGGGEANLLELTSVYASMARTLSHYNSSQHYYSGDFRNLHVRADVKSNSVASDKSYLLDAASVYQTFEALQEVVRPEEIQNWKVMEGTRTVAWKTGTSFGNRDAWAIGTSGKYVVGVWLGNAEGEGRPGLTGIDAAAPLMFDAFNLLPKESTFFERPESEMHEAEVCIHSGELAGPHCREWKKSWLVNSSSKPELCPYHLEVFLDDKKAYRVHGECYEVSSIKKEIYFVLPPVMEQYYRKSHGDYKVLPALSAECLGTEENNFVMDILYPVTNAKLKLPVSQSGFVFEASHNNPLAQIHWHVDDIYSGTTTGQSHQLSLSPEPGKHTLTLVDDAGVMVKQEFEVL